MLSLGINPQYRLSEELSRLSPMPKYSFAGTDDLSRANVLVKHDPLRLLRKLFLNRTAALPREIIDRGVVCILVIHVWFVQPCSVSVNNTVGYSDAVSWHAN